MLNMVTVLRYRAWAYGQGAGSITAGPSWWEDSSIFLSLGDDGYSYLSGKSCQCLQQRRPLGSIQKNITKTSVVKAAREAEAVAEAVEVLRKAGHWGPCATCHMADTDVSCSSLFLTSPDVSAMPMSPATLSAWLLYIYFSLHCVPIVFH